MRRADELVTVHTVREATEAEIIRLALEADGISCSVGDSHQAGFTGILEIPIQVSSADAERAKAIIREAEVA